MKLVGGSPIAERYLWACAAHMLMLHGDGTRDKVNRRIDAMSAAGDFAGHATWVNVSLCLIALTVNPPGAVAHQYDVQDNRREANGSQFAMVIDAALASGGSG